MSAPQLYDRVVTLTLDRYIKRPPRLCVYDADKTTFLCVEYLIVT